MSAVKLLALCFGLACGNYIYQAATGEQWDVARERSFFQGAALLTAWLMARSEPPP